MKYDNKKLQINVVFGRVEAAKDGQKPQYETAKQAESARDQATSEWDEFNKDPEDPWKKKSVYD